jgi:hypothetical protein
MVVKNLQKERESESAQRRKRRTSKNLCRQANIVQVILITINTSFDRVAPSPEEPRRMAVDVRAFFFFGTSKC